MADLNHSNEKKIEKLLAQLTDVSERDPQEAEKGRALFLAQARTMAPAVSAQPDRRHRGWNKNFFERILKNMKPRTLLPTLIGAGLLVAVGILLVNNVTTVSAQQIIDRASAAQAAVESSDGIWHTKLEIFDNPQSVKNGNGGTTTVVETYMGTKPEYYRTVTEDAAGKVLDAFASDGEYSYSLDSAKSNQGQLTIDRIKLDPPDSRKESQPNPTDQTKAAYDHFKNNPRVQVVGKTTWTDGSQAYVLVDPDVQVQKSQNGQDESTSIGAMKMVFNATTYQLLETEATIHVDGKDIVINSVRFLVDEALPAGSQVAWDLSDLKGATLVDAVKPVQVEIKPVSITQEELASHTGTYVLKTIPDGFTVEIVAAPDQPQDQPYTYEIHYINKEGKNFELQAVGTLSDDFINESFYDGAYKTATGITLHYGISQNYVNGMVSTPDGLNFLLTSTMTREQVQTLVEDLVPAK
jgi:hypothetical protein